jgi:hypothetical protein
LLLLLLLLDIVIVLTVWGSSCLEGEEEKAPVDGAIPVTFMLLDFVKLVGFAAQDILEVNLLDPGFIAAYQLFS